MNYLVSINGERVDPAEACVSIFDHGFLFGDSVYEVVRTVGGQLFAFDPHIERLFRSAEQIGLSIPLSHAELRGEALELLRQSGLKVDAYLRLIVTRGVGELTIDPSSCTQATRIFIAKEMPRLPEEAYREGIKLSLVSTARNSRKATNPGIKSGNYLNNVLALMEARKNGALEAVMLNEHGRLTECTTSNLFFALDGVLHTPSLDCGLLAGITRALILEAARADGLELREGAFTPEQLLSADEVFITSTTRDVVPVRCIDDRALGAVPGPLTTRVAELYRAHKKVYLDPEVALPDFEA